MDDDEIILPEKIQEWINQKAAAFTPRRSGGKTTVQYKAKLAYDCASRLNDVNHFCEGISADDAEAIVVNCLGRPYKDLSVYVAHYNKLERVKIASQRDIEAAKSETQERANGQIVDMINSMQSNMHQLIGKIEHLTTTVAPVAAITHDTKPNGEDHHDPIA